MYFYFELRNGVEDDRFCGAGYGLASKNDHRKNHFVIQSKNKIPNGLGILFLCGQGESNSHQEFGKLLFYH